MWKILTLLALVAVPARAEVVREMTPERVREALTWGATQKESVTPFLRGSQDTMFDTPFLRVALLAQIAQREYRRLTEQEMREIETDQIQPYVGIHASPRRIGRHPGVVGVRRVVVTGPNGAAPVEPLKMTPLPWQFGNAFGAKVAANVMLARFPLEVLTSDAEVHVIYEDGEDVTYRFDLKGVR